MQHPDEATIHAWLDGALSAGEAARLEGHVAACSDCAGKVTEARGFIAASARILKSLDAAPRGVIPSTQSRSRPNWPLIQAAAALLVVAAGTMVFRARPVETNPPNVATTVTGPVALPDTAQVPPNVAASVVPSVGSNEGVSNSAGIPTQPRRRTQRAAPIQSQAEARDAGIGMMAKAVPVASIAKGQVADSYVDVGVIPSPPAAPQRTAVATGVATVVDEPLKVLRTDRTPQASRTFYEVFPNRVALLIEPDTTIRSVAEGMTVQATATAVTSRAGGATPIEAASSTRMFRSTPNNTIEWNDEASGKMVILSGPFSTSELLDLKQRIVRERRGLKR